MPGELGPFRLLTDLGSGGMGTVYLARASRPAVGLAPGTRVALKVVHPHLLETRGFFKRFLREADIGRRVRHENVVRTYDGDALRVDGEQHHFLVMEYVEGQTLRDLLARAGAGARGALPAHRARGRRRGSPRSTPRASSTGT